MLHNHGRSTIFTSNKSTVTITNLYALFNGLNFRNCTEIFRTSLSVSNCITFSERLPPNGSSAVAILREQILLGANSKFLREQILMGTTNIRGELNFQSDAQIYKKTGIIRKKN